MTGNPFLSIIIPIKQRPNIHFLKQCLLSLKKQTYTSFEILLVTHESSYLQQKIKPFEKALTLRIIAGNYTKSEARNAGASYANGKYLLHIDIDYVLRSDALAICIDQIKRGAKAVIIHETIPIDKSVWQQARFLEREIFYDDLPLSTPQLIEKKLFTQIHGFDERVDGLDDWGLQMKLEQQHIIPARTAKIATVYEPVHPFEIFRHRFYKGRFVKPLQEYYGSLPQVNLRNRLHTYTRHWRLLVSKPHVTSALIMLKIFDMIPFYLGMLFPKIIKSQIIDPYQEKKVATFFDTENQQSNYALYKHYRETTSLLNILTDKKGTILELGAGTGRITRVLIQKGFNVQPTDISDAMLTELRKKKDLPKPLLIQKDTLPFRKQQFDQTIAIRVIWHIMHKTKRELFLQEAIRVSKKSVIMDFTNKNKYTHPLMRFLLAKIAPSFFLTSYYFPFEEIYSLARKNNTTIVTSIPLEVLPLFWLNSIPRNIAIFLFPLLARLETVAARVIQPGRFLIKLEKTI